MTDKENARELYNALDSLLDLIKSGKIKSPSIKKVLNIESAAALPMDEHGNSVCPDLWKNLSPEQWADVEILMAITKAEAVRGAFRETYGKAGQSA